MADDEVSLRSSSLLLPPTVKTRLCWKAKQQRGGSRSAPHRFRCLWPEQMAERASEGAATPAANCSINYLIFSQRFQLQRISLAVVLLFVLEISNNSLFTQTDNRGGDCEVLSVKRFSFRGFHECGSDLQLLSFSKEPRLISGMINMFALWTNALCP